ncbi:MAG: hypothetical protein ACLFQS_08360 [Bacteroidales bacterium]
MKTNFEITSVDLFADQLKSKENIILKGDKYLIKNSTSKQIDISNATVEELSNFIVSHMVSSLKKDIKRTKKQTESS